MSNYSYFTVLILCCLHNALLVHGSFRITHPEIERQFREHEDRMNDFISNASKRFDDQVAKHFGGRRNIAPLFGDIPPMSSPLRRGLMARMPLSRCSTCGKLLPPPYPSEGNSWEDVRSSLDNSPFSDVHNRIRNRIAGSPLDRAESDFSHPFFNSPPFGSFNRGIDPFEDTYLHPGFDIPSPFPPEHHGSSPNTLDEFKPTSDQEINNGGKPTPSSGYKSGNGKRLIPISGNDIDNGDEHKPLRRKEGDNEGEFTSSSGNKGINNGGESKVPSGIENVAEDGLRLTGGPEIDNVGKSPLLGRKEDGYTGEFTPTSGNKGRNNRDESMVPRGIIDGAEKGTRLIDDHDTDNRGESPRLGRKEGGDEGKFTSSNGDNGNDIGSEKTEKKELEKWREIMLKKHNEYRSLHPVDSLILDDELNESSQKLAEECLKTGRELRTPLKPNSPGENTYESKNEYDPNYIFPPTESVDHWYSEIQQYTFRGIPELYKVIHFTQVVWKTTTKLGCGKATRRDENGAVQYVVCHYSPRGNNASLGTHVLPPMNGIPK